MNIDAIPAHELATLLDAFRESLSGVVSGENLDLMADIEARRLRQPTRKQFIAKVPQITADPQRGEQIHIDCDLKPSDLADPLADDMFHHPIWANLIGNIYHSGRENDVEAWSEGFEPEGYVVRVYFTPAAQPIAAEQTPMPRFENLSDQAAITAARKALPPYDEDRPDTNFAALVVRAKAAELLNARGTILSEIANAQHRLERNEWHLASVGKALDLLFPELTQAEV